MSTGAWEVGENEWVRVPSTAARWTADDFFSSKSSVEEVERGRKGRGKELKTKEGAEGRKRNETD